MAYRLSDDNWKKQMDKAMKPFLATYPPEKVAVDRIGPVVGLWPDKLRDFKAPHLRYFFNWNQVGNIGALQGRLKTIQNQLKFLKV